MLKKVTIVYIILASMFLGACSLIPGQATPELTPTTNLDTGEGTSRVIAEGNLVPVQHASLFFSLPGQVSEVLVEEGDSIQQGDVLARLGDKEQYVAVLKTAELEKLSAQQALDTLNEKASLAGSQAVVQLKQAEQNLIQAKQILSDLDTQAFQDLLDDAVQRVGDADDEVQEARENADKYKDMDPDNRVRKDAEDALDEAQKEYDQAVRERDNLVNQLASAQAQVTLAEKALEDLQRLAGELETGPDPDDLALALARLENADAQVEAAKAALEKLDITAPFQGRVVMVDITAGEQAVPSKPVFVIADFSEWVVETNDLTEVEVVRVTLEEDVQVIPDATPELRLNGQVESISDLFGERAGDIIYQVRIRLDDGDPRLRWGMTVEVRFQD